MNTLHATDKTFETEALQSDVPVLIDFWAPWCGPCKAMGSIVDELAQEYEGRAKVIKVDIGDAPETAAKLGISSIPNFMVFQNGEKQSQQIGVVPKEILSESLSSLLN